MALLKTARARVLCLGLVIGSPTAQSNPIAQAAAALCYYSNMVAFVATSLCEQSFCALQWLVLYLLGKPHALHATSPCHLPGCILRMSAVIECIIDKACI